MFTGPSKDGPVFYDINKNQLEAQQGGFKLERKNKADRSMCCRLRRHMTLGLVLTKKSPLDNVQGGNPANAVPAQL